MERKTFRGMKYRRAGKSGLWVSEIGLGLWKWGDPSYDGSRVGEHDGFRILDRALELGVVHWDTANSYNMGSGNSERLLGRYFQSRGSRSRDMVVLATKVRNSVRDEHVMEWDASPNESGASRKYIIQAVEGCLRRLHTDRIDILYHHAPSLTKDGAWETPLDETWAAFDRLVTQGKVLYLAVSNRTVRQLEQEIDALDGVAQNTSHRIIAVQNQYNALQRGQVSRKDGELSLDDEREFLEFIGEKEIGLVPYLPLAVGLLTGRYRRGSLDQDGRLSEQAGEWFRNEVLTDRNLDLVERLIEIAERKGCSLAQLSIAWLLSRPVVCSVIAGVTRMEHLEDNAAACSVSLSHQEVEEIDHLTGST
jgi:aryl-alcohol dehydrogenase-like predicted oxidoreductase